MPSAALQPPATGGPPRCGNTATALDPPYQQKDRTMNASSQTTPEHTPIPVLVAEIKAEGLPAWLTRNGVTPDRLREYGEALEEQAATWGLPPADPR
jgi:hypothetical protein